MPLRKTVVAALPPLGDIVNDDDRVVHHHADAQDKSGEGDDVDADAHEEEGQHRGEEGDNDGGDDEQGEAEVAHEEQNHDAGEDDAGVEVLLQVLYGVAQQLCLVAGDGELHSGVVLAELLYAAVELVLEGVHPRVALLDDGHADRPAAVGADEAVLGGGLLDDFGKVAEEVDAAADVEADVLYVVLGVDFGVEADVPVVLAVAYREVAQADVVGLDGLGEPFGGDAYGCKPFDVRDDEYLGEDQSAEVHHRHLGYLLDTLGDDAGGQAAQLHGAGGVPDGHVDEEGRDVGGAGL